MITRAHLHRIALCVSTLLLAPLERLSGQESGKLVRLPRGENVSRGEVATRFRVNGVVFLAGQPMALVTDTVRSWPRFLRINEPLAGGYYAKEITREQVILAERGSDSELRLPVTDAAPADPAAAGPAPYTKAWINSPANPMHWNIVSLPDEICRNWAEVNEAEKKEVAAFYELYGWKLVSAENIRGLADFVWERTDHEERVAAAKALRDNFRKLLTPEQTKVWQQMQSYQPIYAVEGKFPPGAREIIAERGPVIAQFKSSLNAEQAAAYQVLLANRAPHENPQYSLPRLSAEASGTGPAPYSKAWINSPANPMLRYPPSFPGDLRDNWTALTTAEKAQVVEFYQKHGWQLLRMETVSGAANDSSWRNIYEKERSAVLKANREAFEKLLSPEQRQAWQHKPSNQLISIADGNPDYTKYRTGEEQRKFFEQFWSTLNAKQKAAYEGMNDFTKADWK